MSADEPEAVVRLTHQEREILRPVLARYARWEDAHDAPVFEAVEQLVAVRVAAARRDADLLGYGERERLKTLMADPWVARNWGMMARYQEGVTRRGAVKYGEFVSVEDLRAALATRSDQGDRVGSTNPDNEGGAV